MFEALFWPAIVKKTIIQYSVREDFNRNCLHYLKKQTWNRLIVCAAATMLGGALLHVLLAPAIAVFGIAAIRWDIFQLFNDTIRPYISGHHTTATVEEYRFYPFGRRQKIILALSGTSGDRCEIHLYQAPRLLAKDIPRKGAKIAVFCDYSINRAMPNTLYLVESYSLLTEPKGEINE